MNNKQLKQSEAVKDTAIKLMTRDSFTNSMARIGFGQPNVTEGAIYPITRLSRNYNLMNSLYRNHWIVRRVIDVVAKDMVKNWLEFTSGMTPEETDRVNKVIRSTNLKQRLIEVLKWARLYGGAAGLMIIEGDDDLKQPLDLDSIMPGAFKGLIVLDRWSGIYPQLETVDDIDSPDFGFPKYYEITANTYAGGHDESFTVHHSRLIRFIGDDLPLWEKLAESYWGASVVERLFDELKKRDNTSANIASLVFLSNLRVLKMQNYGQMVGTTNSRARKTLYNTLQAQNILMSNMGIYVLDAEDDFQTFQYTFSGLPEVYEKFMLDIAGAANIPATRLYGRSPEGMNSTGEGEENNYNSDIEQEQENSLRHQLEKLFPVICMSALGYIPEDLDFNFLPVDTPDQKEIAEQTWRSSEAIRGAYTDGIISQKIALKELKHLGKKIGVFTNITDEDIEKSSNDLENPMDMNETEGKPEDEQVEVQEKDQN